MRSAMRAETIVFNMQLRLCPSGLRADGHVDTRCHSMATIMCAIACRWNVCWSTCMSAVALGDSGPSRQGGMARPGHEPAYHTIQLLLRLVWTSAQAWRFSALHHIKCATGMHRSVLPSFEPVDITLDLLLAEGHRLAGEQAAVNTLKLSEEYMHDTGGGGSSLVGLKGY